MARGPLLPDGTTSVTEQIVEHLADCGIRLVASLPDNWIADLITAIDRDDRFVHVRANREESAIGLCSGAFFGGVPSLALMGASGLTTCVYALTKINYSYQIPLLIFITLRGALGDRAPYHVSNGLYLLPIMDSISLPYTVVDHAEQLSMIPTAFQHSRTINRPVVVAFTRDVLRGAA
jgi:sulfopyruvate decarboxylase subunit alpha